MTAIQFIALPHEVRKSSQDRASDANRQKPEPYFLDGSSIPRRHSLNDVEMGDVYLLLAHKPFPVT
jgi:hypothetical protein